MSSLTSHSARDNPVVIAAKNISKEFVSEKEALQVLDAVSLEIRKGEILGIIGKSGSGKSTLLNIISGLEQPTAGEVVVTGSISYVPQKDLLLPWRTVIANILLPVEIQKGDLKEAASKASTLLESNNLKQFERSYPAEISGGMRQKVSLIRAVLQDSDSILFDEPFSAIDFDTRLHLVKKMRSHIVSNQKAAVLVTHNIEEAIAISDKILVFSDRPAKIIHQANITIPNEYRDPVAVRKSECFQETFEQIWTLMSKQV